MQPNRPVHAIAALLGEPQRDGGLGGNKVRLIAALHYNRQRVYIRAALTHQEYDEGKWKK